MISKRLLCNLTQLICNGVNFLHIKLYCYAEKPVCAKLITLTERCKREINYPFILQNVRYNDKKKFKIKLIDLNETCFHATLIFFWGGGGGVRQTVGDNLCFMEGTDRSDASPASAAVENECSYDYVLSIILLDVDIYSPRGVML
jgi:hypothetical protein